MQYMVAQNPSVDWLTLDPLAYASRIDQVATMIDAGDPDLSRFKANGCKLVTWIGLTDWLITAHYKSVVEKSGGKDAADEFVEYYTAPGAQHCRNGTGGDLVELVGPMFEWLENGTKPSSSLIVATQRTAAAGATPASRPLCQYPKYPKYVSGDPNAASSLTCTMP